MLKKLTVGVLRKRLEGVPDHVPLVLDYGKEIMDALGVLEDDVYKIQVVRVKRGVEERVTCLVIGGIDAIDKRAELIYENK